MPYVFRSYRETAQTGWNAQSPTCDVSVVDACRACLASLLWFDSVEISPFGYFCDADLLELNPALETSHEMRTGSIQCLLSIGARRSQRQETLERETFEHRFPYRRWTPTDPSSDHRFSSKTRCLDLRRVRKARAERLGTKAGKFSPRTCWNCRMVTLCMPSLSMSFLSAEFSSSGFV